MRLTVFVICGNAAFAALYIARYVSGVGDPAFNAAAASALIAYSVVALAFVVSTRRKHRRAAGRG